MLNHVEVQGRLTAEPELRATNSGKAVASFTLACERDYAADGKQRETDFLEVVAWGSTAQFIARNFGKGQMAIITGRLQVRTWEDKNGQKRRTTEIIADNVYFCGKKETPVQGYDKPTGEYQMADYDLLDDSTPLPF